MVVHPNAFGSVSGGTVTKRSLPPFRGAVSIFRGADHVGYFMGRSGLTQQCAAAKPGVHQSTSVTQRTCGVSTPKTKAAAHRTQDKAHTARVRVMIQIGFRRLLVEVVVILALDVVFQ